MSGGAEGTNGGDGFEPFGMSYSTNDLWLELVWKTNATGNFVVHPAWTDPTNGVYDIFETTNLALNVPGLNLTNWLWLYRTEPGETNFLVFDLTEDAAFFRAARTNDTDGDGMTTAYELLASHTNPNVPDAPVIVFQPLSQTVEEGDTVTFSVIAQGPSPLQYQWICSGTNILGATNSSFTISAVQPSDEGDYSVEVIGPSLLSILSSNATLLVEYPNYKPVVTLTGSRQNYSFKNGVTYYVGSRVELYGNTVIEGGAVIKPDWYFSDSTLAIKGVVECKGADPYSPAFLTSVDDDTLGNTLPISTGFPATISNGAPYLDLTYAQEISPSLNNLRIRYAGQAVATPMAKRLDVWNCQFNQCNSAFLANDGSTVGLHNVLFGSCGSAVAGVSNYSEIVAEQITADATDFWSQFPPNQIKLTNSIIVGTIANGPLLFVAHTALNPSGPVFQVAGSGHYYLTNASPYRQAGTTNISPRLLSEFRQKTTQPPVILPELLPIDGEAMFGQQAERYKNGAPDYGYYYAALDYTVGMLINRSAITILPGTVMGFRNEYSSTIDDLTLWGFDLWEGSSFVSHGTPSRPAIFADVQQVQEQQTDPCFALFMPDFLPNDNGKGAPIMDFQFSRFYANANWYHVWAGYEETANFLQTADSLVNWKMQDCELHGGRVNLGPPDDGYYYGIPMDWYYGGCSVSWVNNLFDAVAISLDPTFYWTNTSVNCDMSFAAENNLFRGGRWFFLSPVPASGGNWRLTDNLFDKVAFAQDTYGPLDFHHNGYWPLTSAESMYAGMAWADYHTNDWYAYPYVLVITNQLQIAANGGGGYEQFLAAAPAYQTGPLGDYYLPTATALYHAGSRSADDAGLHHHTTRLDQVKEGDEFPPNHNVSIGLHYLATSGASSLFPRDSDGDGIPDYVENWHGDGAYPNHTDSETDWQTAYSTTNVFDPTNSIYDDRDLSGSGLTGQIKKDLNIDPFDSLNPLEIMGLTPNQPVFGERQIPLALSGQTNSPGSFILYLDGQQAENADVMQSTNGGWYISWDSSTLPNGSHLLQVGYRYSVPGTYDTEVLKSAFGPMQITTVNNPITFDPMNDSFTDVLFLSGTFQQPISAYTINVYDMQHNLLKTINGTPLGNTIDDSWDFTSDGTNIDSGLEVKFSFPQNQDVPQAIVKHYSMERCLPRNSFTLGWGWDYGYPADHASRGQYFRTALVDMLGTDLYGDEFDLLPPGPGGNVPFASAFELDGSEASHDRLLGAIADSDSYNFFFWGHGMPGAFAMNRIDGRPPFGITAAEIANLTGNQGGTNTDFAYRHAYRFVFMDACGTYSRPMAQAFGIPFSKRGSTSTVAEYIQWHRVPRAFIGWDVSIVGANIQDDLANLYRVTAQQIVLGYWQSGASVQDAMAAWDAYLPDKQMRGGITYADVEKQGQVDLYAPMKTWKISGCRDLNRYSPFP